MHDIRAVHLHRRKMKHPLKNPRRNELTVIESVLNIFSSLYDAQLSGVVTRESFYLSVTGEEGKKRR